MSSLRTHNNRRRLHDERPYARARIKLHTWTDVNGEANSNLALVATIPGWVLERLGRPRRIHVTARALQ